MFLRAAARLPPVAGAKGMASSAREEVTVPIEGRLAKVKHTSPDLTFTGGRSSASGLSVTVFGSSGFTGRAIVNRLGKIGSSITLPYRGEPSDLRHLRVLGDLGQIALVRHYLPSLFFFFSFFFLLQKNSLFFSFFLFLFFFSLLKVPCDVYRPDEIKSTIAHSNVVINLIGKNYSTPNFSCEQTNVVASGNIAKACAELGVDRLIHVSALGSSATSKSEFARSKAKGEEAVRKHFPRATILRPAELYVLFPSSYFSRCFFPSFSSFPQKKDLELEITLLSRWRIWFVSILRSLTLPLDVASSLSGCLTLPLR